MDWSKTLRRLALLAACVLIDLLGDHLAVHFNLPLWLDTFGTMLAGYYLGPVMGAVTGVLGHLAIVLADQSSTYLYMLANMSIGIIVGYAREKGHLEDFLEFSTTATQAAIISVFVSVPITLVLRGGVIGNAWGNDIVALFMGSGGSPILATIIGEFYIDFVDKLFCMFLLYVITRLNAHMLGAEKGVVNKLEAVDIIALILFGLILIITLMRSQAVGAFYESNLFKDYLIVVLLLIASWITWFISRAVHKREMDRQREELALAEQKASLVREAMLAIARMVDARDIYTSQHSIRVSEYSVLIGRKLGLSDSECENLRRAGLLHDIGKMGIPDYVLNKEGKLTEEEYDLMKSHVTLGASILEDFTMVDQVVEGAQYHHERFDGHGYPSGLSGEDIPLYGRIICIADAFDAMTSDRIYRKRRSLDYVLGELKRGRGTQFDPQLCDIFLSLIDDGEIDVAALYREESRDVL